MQVFDPRHLFAFHLGRLSHRQVTTARVHVDPHQNERQQEALESLDARARLTAPNPAPEEWKRSAEQ